MYSTASRAAVLAAWFLALTIAGESSFAQQLFVDPMFGVSVQNDVIYGVGATGNPTSGGVNLEMDIYSPTGPGAPATSPALVAIHGGGFTGGDKGSGGIVGWANEFAQRGYVVASINYRLVGDNPTAEPGPLTNSQPLGRAVNAAINDAAVAVANLRANASTYQIDASRIAIGGSSAGAVTAMGVGFLEHGNAADVSAVVSLWGSLDNPFQGGLQTDLHSEIDSDDPGIFLTVGTNDTMVSGALFYDSNVALDAYLGQIGHPHEFFPLQGAGHGPWNRYYNDVVGGQTVFEHNVDFLYQQLDLQGLVVPEPSVLGGLSIAIPFVLTRRRR